MRIDPDPDQLAELLERPAAYVIGWLHGGVISAAEIHGNECAGVRCATCVMLAHLLAGCAALEIHQPACVPHDP